MAEWLLVALIGVLLLYSWVWRPPTQGLVTRLAGRTRLCMLILFVLPIALRLLLLRHHPVPTPNIYDEFSHLLVADTLLHGRLSNPPHALHQFFETFFVLQEPTYSSIYPLGLGLQLAFGRLISGCAWTGILITTGLLCAGCYWMLRAWVNARWALLGGVLAVIQFGPLCLWTNCYWGGSLGAVAGCLVFGSLPRVRANARTRDALLLGLGFGIHMLVRQFESMLLLLSILLFFAPMVFSRASGWRTLVRISGIALAGAVPSLVLILLQNRSVTHTWTTLPEQLSQYQYGVPTSLTFEPNPTPHVPLTREQELDYRAQALTHGLDRDSLSRFLLRLEYRVRYLRFFFLPPLYVAVVAFCFGFRRSGFVWLVSTLAIFVLGTNLFPYLLVHYLSAVTCLFVLVSIIGLQQLSRIQIHGQDAGAEAARVLFVLCFANFALWYSLHLFERPSFTPILRYETWDAINHGDVHGRRHIAEQLAGMDGNLLVFVRYTPRHVYQNEWVWNRADIDGSKVVFARDLGADQNHHLISLYPGRKVLVLEPDGSEPTLQAY